MVAQGCERTKICDKLFISNSTLKGHISDIKEKLSEDNIYMYVIKAIQIWHNRLIWKHNQIGT